MDRVKNAGLFAQNYTDAFLTLILNRNGGTLIHFNSIYMHNIRGEAVITYISIINTVFTVIYQSKLASAFSVRFYISSN